MAPPLNILIFSSNSLYRRNVIGGAESALRLIAEKLAEQGFRVTYFTNGISRIPGIKKKRINGVDVFFFTPVRWPLLKNRIFPQLSTKFITIQKRIALAKLIKKRKINLIHTFNPYPDTFDIIKLRDRYKLNFKIVTRIAGIHWVYQLDNKIIEPETVEFIFNNVDVFNFLDIGLENLFNQKCKEYGINYTVPEKFIHDIGVDFNFFQGERNQSSNDNFTIICPAKFSPCQKRQDILIDAISSLKQKNIHLEFAGEGALHEKYRTDANRKGIGHRVKFHGFLSKEELKKAMLSADLMALPTEYEGVSKAVVEAQAMGLPVLVSDVPALNSFLTHNETGFLVENKIEAWAAMIQELSQDKKRLSKIAESGHQFAHATYNADINIIKYIRRFENAISNN